ncbi:MAG: DMT family transporter [Patescibacteria group bacterium]|nr:DMT family transporter [Patescibacteria group bacterium]
MWLLLVIAAHLLYAIVSVGDKYILSREVKSPLAYAFYNGLLGGSAIFLFPLAWQMPRGKVIVAALAAGAFFVIALIFFFSAIEKNPTSRIIPFIGTMVPLFTFILSSIFLQEKLNRDQFIAFYLLILGGILITAERRRRNLFSRQGVMYGLAAAFCFAASFILTKYVYNLTPFWVGFIWIKIGSLALALSIFLVPLWRKKIKKAPQKAGTKVSLSYLGIRVIAALAAIMLNYAIFLSSVIIVNALQGVQYIFLLIIALILSEKIPALFAEEFKNQKVQKIIAVVLITFGLAILAFK